MVTRAGEGALSIRAERVGVDHPLVVELDGLPLKLLARDLSFGWRPAGFEELRANAA
jgi:hypothetical protein